MSIATVIELKPCESRQCDRRVSVRVLYCCHPCDVAWNATPRFEPHAHTSDCDDRHAQRGPVEPWERL